MSNTEFVMVIDQPTAEMIDAAQAIKRGKYETVCPERVQIVERYKAMVLLSPKPIESQVEYEIAGYEGSSGLYYSRLAAVANGEQSVEPVYRVKK